MFGLFDCYHLFEAQRYNRQYRKAFILGDVSSDIQKHTATSAHTEIPFASEIFSATGLEPIE